MLLPYRQIEPGKLAPIVDVSLFGKSRIFHVEAFIDSGADLSVFDISTAQLIGLNYKKGLKIAITVGDGDKIVSFLHEVKVRFAQQIFFAPICFSPHLGSGFNLVGRKGFFEKFRICFHEKRKFLSVSDHD